MLSTYNNPEIDNQKEINQVLYKLGYRWSSEAQVYYSTDFELATLTPRQANALVKHIWIIDSNFAK